MGLDFQNYRLDTIDDLADEVPSFHLFRNMANLRGDLLSVNVQTWAAREYLIQSRLVWLCQYSRCFVRKIK